MSHEEGVQEERPASKNLILRKTEAKCAPMEQQLIQTAGLGGEHCSCDGFNRDVTQSEAIHILSKVTKSRDGRARQQ